MVMHEGDVTAATGAGPTPGDIDSASRQRILEAGAACLARFGNEKTSIQDVADAAGLSRATIYRYFSGRGDLFRAVTAFERARDAREVHERAGSTDTLEEAVAVVIEVLAMADRRYHTHQHLQNHDRGLAQYLMFERATDVEPFRALVAPYVERARARGELQAGVSAEDAVEWIAMTAAMLPALTAGGAVQVQDPVDVGRFFAARLCRGVTGPPAPTRRR